MTRSAWLTVAVAGVLVAGCAKAPQKGGPGLPRPTFTATADYVGLPTALDGSASSDPAGRALTYAWHFVSVPTGSVVTDASFDNAGAATAKFVGDRGGTYRVSLVATTSDGAVNAITQDVVVPTVALLYYGANIQQNNATLGAGVVRSDGTGSHPLACADVFDAGWAQKTDPEVLTISLAAGVAAIRSFDAPSPLFVFPKLQRVANPSGGSAAVFSYNLYAANDQNDCNGRPATRLDTTGGAIFGPSPQLYFWPRFSPDGKRVVFLAQSVAGSNPVQVVTVGADGAALRIVGPIANSTNGTPTSAPLWIDNNTVGWVESASTSGPSRWRVQKATDAAGAAASTYLDCTGGAATPVFEVINQVEVVNGVVLVSGAINSTHNTTPGFVDIYRMAPGSCVTTDKLTDETAGYFSGDFAVSPDGSKVVFASTRGAPLDLGSNGGFANGDIYTVNAVGTPTVTRVAGDPALFDIGPRFVAGGKQIVWTQLSSVPADLATIGAPSTASLMIANADGTNAHKVLGGVEKAGEVNYVLGGGNLGFGCTWVGAAAGGGALLVVALALVAMALVRRRKI
ncbi:MAG: hypothetical protein JWN44_1386 [Myxococcales bacterium]|nr:hypothetical protein [Myxococcales bacterium]